MTAAGTCPALSWQVLAAIGKVESDHGRSSAPGVRDGINRAGCCAGPMQFNLTNGPPSTWDTWGTGVRAHVYDPAHAVPAAARKLCGDGLARPEAVGRDPCPQVLGSAALHTALRRYNNACWYVHEVVTLAGRYTRAAPAQAPSRDPFVRALVASPRTTTASHGCDPRTDLASGRLDLRVQSLLAVLAERHTIRLSCLRSGHSRFVKGTTRISNHTVWRAVDIDMVDGRAVSRRSHPARTLALWLTASRAPCAPPRSARRSPSAAAPTSPTKATRATSTSGTAPHPADQTPAVRPGPRLPAAAGAGGQQPDGRAGRGAAQGPGQLPGGAEVDPEPGDIARLAGRHLHPVAVGPPQLGQRRPEPDAGPGPRAVATQRRRVGWGAGPLYCPSSTERWTASTW